MPVRAPAVLLLAAAPLVAQVENQVHTLALEAELPCSGRLGGVAADRAGNLYVSNFRAEVWRVSPDGAVTLLAGDLRGSSGNAVTPDGDLLQCSFSEGRIYRFDAQGRRSLFAEGLPGPIGLVAGADGDVFVCCCSDNAVYRVGADGDVERVTRSPDLACPNGIAQGEDGALFVVSFDSPHVVRVAPDGDTSRFATLPGDGNAHLVAVDGMLYVTQIRSNRIYRIDGSGRHERYAGSGEPGLQDGGLLEASLSRPNGLALAADRRSLITNNLDGQWRSGEPATLVLRRIPLPRPGRDH